MEELCSERADFLFLLNFFMISSKTSASFKFGFISEI